MLRIKILVTGAFNAGKTEFIHSACEGKLVRSERAVTGEEAAVKRLTTVALDFGRLVSTQGNELLLFGTPGQSRFEAARNILARGAQGAVLVVDCSDERSVSQGREFARWIERQSIPLVVAANKQDVRGALPGAALRGALELAERTKVVECSATKRESVLAVLAEVEGEVCRGPGTRMP